MCRLVTCKKCQKPTWAGCGAHVEQVLGHVPVKDRCSCHAEAAPAGKGGLGKAIRSLFGR